MISELKFEEKSEYHFNKCFQPSSQYNDLNSSSSNSLSVIEEKSYEPKSFISSKSLISQKVKKFNTLNYSEINSKYMILSTISEGFSFSVIKVLNILNKKIEILKILREPSNIGEKAIQNELNTLENIYKLIDNDSNPSEFESNFIRLNSKIEYISDSNIPYLCSEYINFELFGLLEKNEKFNLPLTCSIMRKILQIIRFLHNHKICHRDLKPENIMIREDYSICLIDFEFASIFAEENQGKIEYLNLNEEYGTKHYIAPELIWKKRQSTTKIRGDKLDIFACGMIFYVMNNGSFLLKEAKEYEIFLKYPKSFLNKDNILKEIEGNEDKELYIDFLLKCLNVPEKRGTCEELINHKFLIKYELDDKKYKE